MKTLIFTSFLLGGNPAIKMFGKFIKYYSSSKTSCFSGFTKANNKAPKSSGMSKKRTATLTPKAAMVMPSKKGDKMPENFPKTEKKPKNSLALSIGNIFAK